MTPAWAFAVARCAPARASGGACHQPQRPPRRQPVASLPLALPLLLVVLLLLPLPAGASESQLVAELFEECTLGPRVNGAIRLVDDVPVLQTSVAESNYVFHHIPKTGGTTFRNSVRQGDLTRDFQFCQAATFDKYEGYFSEAMPAIVEASQNGSCNLIAYELNAVQRTHRKALCHLMNEGYLAMALLREPTTHVMSMVAHHLSRNHFSSVSEKLFNITCDSTAQGTYRCTNPQVAHLSSSVDAADAIDLLRDRYFFFGIMEHMLASYCLLAFQLGDTYNGPITKKKCNCAILPSRKTAVVHVNVNTHPVGFTSQEISHILGITMLDRRLHAFAVDEFFRRIAVVEKEWNIKIVC